MRARSPRTAPAAAVLAGLLALAGATARPATAQPGAARSTGKVHLVVVADTFPAEFRKASASDGANIKTVFEDNLPADRLDVVYINTFDHPELKADPGKLRDLILRTVAGLKVGADDALVFYYTGHGAYDLDGHFMDFGRERNPRRLHRHAVFAELEAKAVRPRLTVMMTDCCNVFNPNKAAPVPQIVALNGGNPRPRVPGAGFDALFLQPKGVVNFTSSDKDQVSMTLGDHGSLFTLVLSEHLGKAANQGDITWKKLTDDVRTRGEDLFKREFPDGVDSIDAGGMKVKQRAHTLQVFALELGEDRPVPVPPGRAFGAAVTNRPGVLLVAVNPTGPAAAAGLRSGDVVFQIKDTQTPDTKTFSQELDRVAQAGQAVPVSFLRPNPGGGAGAWVWGKVNLQPRPGAPFGVRADPRPGVLVIRVEPNSAAHRIGLQVGDAIHKLDSVNVPDMRAYSVVVNPSNPPRTASVIRNHQDIELPRRP